VLVLIESVEPLVRNVVETALIEQVVDERSQNLVSQPETERVRARTTRCPARSGPDGWRTRRGVPEALRVPRAQAPGGRRTDDRGGHSQALAQSTRARDQPDATAFCFSTRSSIAAHP
jgi:hypothetical protein